MIQSLIPGHQLLRGAPLTLLVMRQADDRLVEQANGASELDPAVAARGATWPCCTFTHADTGYRGPTTIDMTLRTATP